MADGLTYRPISINANGRAIHALEAGEGPLVIALHGFPDLPISYRHQFSALAENGYHVIAPCMRGYFPSDELDGPFETAGLVQEVLALIDQLTDQTAILIGHDWGAITAAGAASIAPEKVSKIVAMSVPPGGTFRRALLANPTQQRRSWYMFFFQLPFAEAAVAHDDFAFIAQLWKEWSPGWECPREIMAELKEAFRHPGVLKAALGYYRSTFNPALQDPGLSELRKRLGEPIAVPTMYLHGADDGCIGAEVTEGMEAAFLRDFEKHIIPSAGHFVHQEQPAAVNRFIIDFLRKRPV